MKKQNATLAALLKDADLHAGQAHLQTRANAAPAIILASIWAARDKLAQAEAELWELHHALDTKKGPSGGPFPS